MFPIFLDLRDRLCVVVGGGPVGRRKAGALLAGGGRVRLVCLEPPSPELRSERLEWLTESYRTDHLHGALLAFAAATAEVNRQVVADAAERRILCNVADAPTTGDFFVPSVVRRGDFVLAVGTGGAAPGLARKVRRQLERTFDATWGDWIALLHEMRDIVSQTIRDPARRQQAHAELTRRHWLRRLRHEDAESVRRAMHEAVRALAEDGSNPG